MIVSWSWVWKKHLLKGWGEVHHMKNCGGQGRKPIACDLRPLRQHCITKPTCLYKGYFYLGSETLWKTVVCWLRPHFIQFLVIMEVMSHGIFLYFTQSQLFFESLSQIVTGSFQVSTWFFTTFSVSGMKEKVRYLDNLHQLFTCIKPEQIDIPPFVLEYDARVSSKTHTNIQWDRLIHSTHTELIGT